MSLIQEALKRKDDENSGIPPKAIPVVPSNSRGAPAARIDAPPKRVSLPPSKEKTSRTWPVLVISLSVSTVVALVTVGLLYSARSLTKESAPAPTAGAVVEPVPPQPAAPAPAAVQPAPAVVAPVATPKPVAITAAPETAPAKEPTPAPATVAPVVFSIPTGVVKEGVAEKKPASSDISVVPVSKPVVSQSSWPTLKVVGVMAPRSTAQPGAAIIDGNLVECGDGIRGVKVQVVDKTGVWFEFRGQTQYVRVGQTTL